MKLRKIKQGGFTLLELLVVVAILAIIAGAVISAISGQEERAGQGVALNTMGALENSTRQTVVLKGGLPNDLDSLLCGALADTSSNQDNLGTVELLGSATNGGLADGLAGKLTIVTLAADATGCDDDTDGATGVCMLTESGIDRLRYASVTSCDDDDTTVGNIDVDNDGTPDVTGAGDEEANEILANTLFWPADAGGAGASVSIDEGSALDIAVLSNPTSIGQDPGTVVGVFGVGNFSEMSRSETAKTLSRGPIDGNVEGNGERYSHFSLAIKLAELPSNTEIQNNNFASVSWELDEVEIVAVLDSDGDNFDDEVAEFAGLEDE